MDKYEFNIKAEQLKKQVKAGDYETAQRICDSIDWRRVNNVSLLSMVASVYEHNKDYDEAKEILLLAYEKAPIGKRLLYKLSTLALRQGNVAEAEEYYKEFYDLAKDDPRQHILRYLILKAKGAPATHLISSLEAYNRMELDERWMYELAELYHKAGMSDECVAMCDKIMLMFGIGQYVNKAIYLKTVMEGRELNEYQKSLVDNRDQYEFYSDYDEQAEGAQASAADEAAMEARRQQDMEIEEAGIGNQGATGTLPRLNSEIETSGTLYQYDDTEDVPESERTRILDDINTVLPNTKQWNEIEQENEKEREAAVRQAAQRQVDEAMEQAKEAAKAAAQARAAARAATEARENAEAQVAEIQAAAGAGVKADTSAHTGFSRTGTRPAPDLAGVAAGTMAGAAAGATAGAAAGATVGAAAGATAGAAAGTTASVAAGTASGAAAGTTASAATGASSVAAEPAAQTSQQEQTDDQSGTLYTVNFLVARKSDDAGLAAAIDLLRMMHQNTGSTNQVTKIKGEKLNQRGVTNSIPKLEGKDLIVENAGDLSTQSVNELIDMIYAQPDKRVVVLVDNHMQIERLKNRYSELMNVFYVDDEDDAGGQTEPAATEQETYAYAGYASAGEGTYDHAGYAPAEDVGATIIGQEDTCRPSQKMNNGRRNAGDTYAGDAYTGMSQAPAAAYVPETRTGGAQSQMDIDEFAKYCQEYAASIDCTIPGKSLLALYERIEIMEEDGIPLTKDAAVDLIEETADKAENPSLGKKLTGMFSPRYDKEGLLILKEENFLP